MSSISQYLPYMNNAIAQKGQARANQYQGAGDNISQLLQALSAIAQKNQMMSEADNYFSGGVTNAPTMKPNFGQQGATPIGENFDGQVPVQGRTAMPNPMMATAEISQRSQDPQTLIRGLMNANPEIARRAQAGIQGIQLQAPNRQAFSPYGTEDVNPFSPTRGQRTEPIEKPDKSAQEKTVKLPTGFAEITDPATKAKIWNETYGGNLSAEDFKSVQERPYFQPVIDRDGKIKIFDSRTGKFSNEDSGVIKAAPTEIKQSIASMNDNLNSIKAVREILNRGDLTGAVKGRTTKVGTRFFDNAEAEKLQARIGQLRTIVYGLSGKAINESELSWLENTIIPSLQQPSGNFETRLDELQAWINRKKQTVKQQFPNIKDIDGAVEKPAKSVSKKQYSPSANKTKIIYDDGTEEIVDGKK